MGRGMFAEKSLKNKLLLSSLFLLSSSFLQNDKGRNGRRQRVQKSSKVELGS
jgi:hypothetical protein